MVNSVSLSDLLVCNMRGAVKAAAVRPSGSPTLCGLLLGSLCKRAGGPEIVTARSLPKGYEQKMQQAEQQRAAAARKAQAAQRAGKYSLSLTGDKEYDNSPDVVARRRRYEEAYNEYVKRNPSVVQQMSKADIMRQIDAEGGVKSWGDTSIGKAIGTAIAAPFKVIADGIGANVSYLTSAPKGTTYSDWVSSYMGNANKDWDSIGHDVANNFQIFGNSALHHGKQLVRHVGEYLDPRSYGNSTRARNLKTSYRNTRENAEAAYQERQRRVMDNFHDRTLADKDNALGWMNYYGSAGTGALFGETLATAGAGTLAKGIGTGIMKGTQLAANAARGASVATSAGRGLGMASRVRGMAANGINAMGETLAMPFNAVGTLANPVAAAQKGITKGLPAAYRGVKQTVGAGIGRPMRGLWNFAHHPVQSIGSTVRHPMQAGKAVYNWGKDTLTPAARLAFSKPAWQGSVWYEMGQNGYNGNYGDAAGALGTMGLYGAAGGWAIPAMIAHSMYTGGGGDNYNGGA